MQKLKAYASPKWRNWILGLFLIICANEILMCYQMAFPFKPISYVFDCVSYIQMTYAFITHHIVTVDFPFSQRLLTPFIASLLPFKNIYTRFLIINWISIDLALLLLITVWLRLKAPFSLIIFMIPWILLNKSVVGFFFDNVVNTDTLGFLFNAVLVWIILKRNYYGLVLMTPFAVLERESFISSLFIIFICEVVRFTQEKENKPLLLTSAALLLGVGVNCWTNSHLFYPGEGSSLSTLAYWIKSRIHNPIMLLLWFSESATVLGGLVLLLKYVKRSFIKNYPFIILSLISLSYLAFGLLAGSAMSRIMWGGLPFIATVFLYLAAHTKVDKVIITLLYILSLCILGIEYLVPWKIGSLSRDGTIYVTALLTALAYIVTFITLAIYKKTYKGDTK